MINKITNNEGEIKMREKLIVNLTGDIHHSKKMARLLDLCIKIDKSVDNICKNADKIKYDAFGGNHCIQTAACMKYIIDGILKSSGCKTHIIYGIMTDNECSADTVYNHAYLFMEYRGLNYVIDVSRKERQALIACTKEHIFGYGMHSPLTIPEYNDIEIMQISKLDFEDILNQEHEYFTGISSREFFNKVKFLCQSKIDSFKKW